MRLRLGLAVLDAAGVAASNSGAVAEDAISVSVGEGVGAAGVSVGFGTRNASVNFILCSGSPSDLKN